MDTIEVFAQVAGLSVRAAVMRFASAGVPVFPCVPSGKRPLVKHGFHEASIDFGQVAAWWRRWPAANIGIPTGAASGVEVVDVDVNSNGTAFPAFRAAHREGHATGWTTLVRTPSGGMHAYYPADAERPQPSWQAARAHVDFRGAGGYVIAPPSVIVRPNRLRVPYRLIVASGSPSESVDATRLRNFLDPSIPTPTSRAPSDIRQNVDARVLAGWVAARSEGERNRGLFWAACRLAETGTPPSATLDALRPAAEHAGLEPREIIATIRSAYRTTRHAQTREAETVRADSDRVARGQAGRVLS